jgi:DHA1 family tetracycline resistance protein-like MFS transporter
MSTQEPEARSIDATKHAGSPGPRRAGTAFILVTVLLDSLGLGLIIPVTPRLVSDFLNNDIPAASHFFGVLVSVYAAMQFAFAPVVGGLSDRYGRRPIIFASLLGAAASYLLSGFAPALWWLFIGRVIAGITSASFSAANAYIADVTPPEKRASAFGMVGAVFGLGFILGPALGGALGSFGLRVPFFVGAGLNFVNLLYGIFVLPESLAPADRRPFSLARANPIGALRALGRYPIVFGLSGTMMCAFLAQWILQSVWALHTQSRFGWSLGMVGISLMLVGIGTAFVQGFLVRVAVPRLGEQRAFLVGLAMSITGHILLGLADRSWMMLSFIFVLALGGLAGPAAQALISREVPASEQGELQGALNSLTGIAAIVGPLIGTNLLATFGPKTAPIHVPGAAFFASAAINTVGLLLAIRLFRSRRATALSAPSRKEEFSS